MITETNENTVPSTIEEVVKKYGLKVKGMKSSCGIFIGEISDHAAKRIVERGISLAVLEDAIANSSIVYPGNKQGTTCQQKGNIRLVLANNDGTIVSVVARIHSEE